ncbi:MAG: hypothetical protein Q9221_008889 [Calogaya cf. arnoldii]
MALFRRMRNRKRRHGIKITKQGTPDGPDQINVRVYELEGQPLYELPGETAPSKSADGPILSIPEPTQVMVQYTDDPTPYEICDDCNVDEYKETSFEDLSKHRRMVYQHLELALDDFRFLYLHRAEDEASVIYCTLVKGHIESNSDDRPIYEALSYTWGEAGERGIIFVNGHPFSVTMNLCVALKYIRKAERTRTIWIDAICINQDSTLEKTHQVRLMRDIYRGASKVLVWLGESDGEMSMTVEHLQKRGVFQLQMEDELGPFLLGLAKIFKQPWWSRIWVVQEVLVASEPPLLGCGHIWLSWDDLEVGVNNLKRQEISGDGDVESGFENPLDFYDIGRMTSADFNTGYIHSETRNAWSMRKQWWNLEDLLTATCNRKTTQPHDKVFSLLGLTLDRVLTEVPIDYDQPHTVAFQKAMVHVLRSNMNFLVHATHPHKSSTSPTWCVDFLTADWPSYARDRLLYRSIEEIPSRKFPSSVVHDPVKGTIEVYGTLLGRINYVNTSKCAPASLAESEKIRYRQDYTAERPNVTQRTFRYLQHDYLRHDFQAFHNAARKTLKNHFSTEEVSWMLSTDIVWRTLAESEPKLSAADFALLQTEALDYDYIALETRAQVSFNTIGKLANRTLEAITAVSLNLIDKSVFTTTTGFLGQAMTSVDTVLEGDWLCLIHGCHVPIIIRQCPDMTKYKVVTYSWISNLIDELLVEGIGQRSERLTLY